jgi:hypothetical protein
MNPRFAKSKEGRYWIEVRACVARYCQDNGIEKLTKPEADALRYKWHRHMHNPESHTTWDFHAYAVSSAWFAAYQQGGDIAAAFVDTAAIRDASIRNSCFWVIDNKYGRQSAEGIARDRLRLPEFEAVDWDQVPTNVLRQIAMTCSNRSRTKAATPASAPVAARVEGGSEDPFKTGETPF